MTYQLHPTGEKASQAEAGLEHTRPRRFGHRIGRRPMRVGDRTHAEILRLIATATAAIAAAQPAAILGGVPCATSASAHRLAAQRRWWPLVAARCARPQSARALWEAVLCGMACLLGVGIGLIAAKRPPQ